MCDKSKNPNPYAWKEGHYIEIGLRHIILKNKLGETVIFQFQGNKMTKYRLCLQRTVQELSVWYKTKFGSQNFGYQLWCLICNICEVFKNMFNMGL